MLPVPSKCNRMYIVEKILHKRIREGRVEYFLKWKDWPPSTNSWEKENELHCSELIEEYEKRQKSRCTVKRFEPEKLKMTINIKSPKEDDSASKLEDKNDNQQSSSQFYRKARRSDDLLMNAADDSTNNNCDFDKTSCEDKLPDKLDDEFDNSFAHKWGEPLEENPQKIDGVFFDNVTRRLFMYVDWKDKNRSEVITAEQARENWPQMLIDFYESIIEFDEDS